MRVYVGAPEFTLPVRFNKLDELSPNVGYFNETLAASVGLGAEL